LNKASDQGIIASVTEYFSNSEFIIRIQCCCIHLLLIQWLFLLRYCWTLAQKQPRDYLKLFLSSSCAFGS